VSPDPSEQLPSREVGRVAKQAMRLVDVHQGVGPSRAAVDKHIVEDLRHQIAARALQGSVGHGDVEVISALEVGFDRETHALEDVALYQG
jgi:hypothetical protein